MAKRKEPDWTFDGKDIMCEDVEIAIVNSYHFEAARNGRLLAAAPKLLRLVKKALRDLPGDQVYKPERKAYQAVIAEIEKQPIYEIN